MRSQKYPPPVANRSARRVPIQSNRGSVRMGRPGNAEWLQGYFDGEDVFVIAGGPSLHGWDPSRVADRNTIVVNHGIRFVPNLDIACFIDVEFVVEMQKYYGIRMQDWPGKVVSSQKSLLEPAGQVAIIHVSGIASEFSLHKVYGEYSSAIFAAQVAKLAGARTVYLLGVDCKWHGKRDHWYPSDDTGYKHRRGYIDDPVRRKKREQTYHDMVRHWQRIDGPFVVVGDSALTKWPKMELEDVLRRT